MKTRLNLLFGFMLLAGLFITGCTGDKSQKEADSTEETAEESETKEVAEAPGQILYVTHNVKDYDVWKAGYDAHDSTRVASGLHKIGVARGQENPNNIHVALSMDDLEKAKAFAGGEDLKNIMEELGVEGPPEIHYLSEVSVVSDPIENKNRIVIMHEVKDYDAWKTAFDDHEAFRAEHGLATRAILRGIDNSNMVSLIFAYDDKEKLDAFMASEDLKSKMEEAGVVGEPNVQLITWAELDES